MIIDDYILEKCIGKGSFGEVYYSTKKDTNEKYATKKLDRQELEHTEGLKYLQNEISILTKINHPNVVKFADVKKTKKHFYIMMEYCNGGELSKALDKYQGQNGHPFTEEIVQYLMRQIVDAVNCIHQMKIIHRDLKLDNILLHYDNEEDKKNFNILKAKIKIIDFGFACLISDTGLKFSVLGSPIYMDPLILKKLTSHDGKTRQLGYNQKADIWSLGALCYEMLVGKTAFASDDVEELSDKVEQGKYSIPTNLSREVISFLNGMLQYNSEERLKAEELLKHPFLTKKICDFSKVLIRRVSTNVKEDKLNMNTKKLTKSIRLIFNPESEKRKEGEEKIEGFYLSNEIPDNPVNVNINGSTQEEIKKEGLGDFVFS